MCFALKAVHCQWLTHGVLIMGKNQFICLKSSCPQVGAVQGSMRTSATEVLEATARSIEELDPLVEQAETDGLVRKGVLSKKRLRWAFGILLSRLVRLPGAPLMANLDQA